MASQDLFIFFHSEGDIRDLIPHLLQAGVRALHPLEEESGMDIQGLIKDYKNDAVFIGHMNIAEISKEKNFFDKFKERLDLLKRGCSYIYSTSCPIMPNISFKDYSRVIDVVKEAGAY